MLSGGKMTIVFGGSQPFLLGLDFSYTVVDKRKKTYFGLEDKIFSTGKSCHYSSTYWHFISKTYRSGKYTLFSTALGEDNF